MKKLKLEKGQQVVVVRTGPMEEGETVYQGNTKPVYNNPIKIVATGEETVWAHGSGPAQQRFEEAADIGDTVTIDYMQLGGGNYCYSFRAGESLQESTTPVASTISPELKAWMDKVVKFKNDTEMDITTIKARLNKLEGPPKSTTPNKDEPLPF